MTKSIYEFLRLRYVGVRNFYLYLRRLPYIGTIKKYVGLDMSLITSNCFSGRIMQDLKMQYNTPTLGMWILPSDFAKFCDNLAHYKKSKVQIVGKSKTDLGNYKMTHAKHPYPVGLLGDDIEIHFLHYKTEKEAVEKWERRSERINLKNYILIGFEQNGCTQDDIKRFDAIEHKNKVFFASKPLDYPCVCYIPEFASLGYAGDPYKKSFIYYKYFAQWLKSHFGN